MSALFRVPSGRGGLTSYHAIARSNGVNLYRMVDRKTGAKTLFAKSGIPGAVGGSASALWSELAHHMRRTRTFRVWPFEGQLDLLVGTAPIIVGEVYPRAAYATALSDEPPITRSRLALGKTHASARREAIRELQDARWVRALGVSIADLGAAQDSEDNFDACITAAALLRCVLEEVPLCSTSLSSDHAEGGILGSGAINLALSERTFRLRSGREHRSEVPLSPAEPRTDTPKEPRSFRCPIEGCKKTYEVTRGGWDGHVGSARLHPNWLPEVISPEDRKKAFRTQFPRFFD